MSDPTDVQEFIDRINAERSPDGEGDGADDSAPERDRSTEWSAEFGRDRLDGYAPGGSS